MLRTMVSLVGTGDYVPARYCWEEAVSEPTPYVQVATAELLAKKDRRPDRVALLLTAAAEKKHGPLLRDALRELGYDNERCTLASVSIPEGRTENELWAIFNAVGQAIEGANRLIFDATHGFRSLQVVTLLAATFYRHAHDVQIEHVLYGAFETLGRPLDVKERYEKTGVAETAPLFDLTEMLLLPEWAGAAAEWARTGNAGALLELASDPARDRRAILRGSDELTTLIDRVRDVSHALSLVRHADVADRAREARKAASRVALAGDTVTPRLAPMRALADRLSCSLEPIALDEGDPQRLDEAYLRSQLALARYYERRGRMLEAFSVLRELWVSCALRVAEAAGVRTPRAKDVKKSRERDQGIVQLTVTGQRERHNHKAEKVRRLLDRHPALKQLLQDTCNGIVPWRNKLDHCWIGSDNDRIKGLLQQLQQEHRKAANGLESMIPLLDQLRPLESDTSATCFVNLTNYPSDTWSEALRAAALELATTIKDVPLPEVAPSATSEEISARADRVVEQLPPGCTHALVMGEFTLTFALVQRLEAQGVQCFAAAGERIEEATPHGRCVSRFEFRGFRRYPVFDDAPDR